MVDKSQEQSGRMPWASYAAVAWCILFGGLHLYWGLGGNAGLAELSTPSNQTVALTRDPLYIWLIWGVVAACVVGAIAALAPFQTWGQRIPRWIPLTILWIACGISLVRGIGNPVQTLLLISGVFPYEPLNGPLAAAWYRWMLIDATTFSPYFVLGGLFFGATAWAARRRGSDVGGRDMVSEGQRLRPA